MRLRACHGQLLPNTPPVDTLVATSIGVVMYLATAGWLNWLAVRPLVFLGGISYSLYLTHHWLGLTILKKADQYGVEPNLALALAMGVSLLVATGFTYGIERPSLARLRQHIALR